MRELIVVAGHAPFRRSVQSCPAAPEHDAYWVLQPFQRGEPPFYIEHIRQGLELLKKQPFAALCFSGGRTRVETPWSEGKTYAAIAKHFSYWEADSQRRHRLKAHIVLEEFARDSFENLQCSLYAFYQHFGCYPASVTVVGWRFKAARFALHCQALGIPTKRFTYIGCNDPDNLDSAQRGEAKALAAFRRDPKGEQPPLNIKRAERNPFHKEWPYAGLPSIKVG